MDMICQRLNILIILHWILNILITNANKRSDEFCQFDSFKAHCKDDEVIMVTSARYGRMGTGKCIVGEGYLGCSADVLGYIDSKCSGRRKCQVEVSSLADVVQPCRKDFISYLQASYTCLKVLTGAHCTSPLTSTSGVLPSLSAVEGGGGSHRCPWKIKASQGQKIKLSIAMFGSAGTVFTDGRCLIKVVIQDTTIYERELCGFSRLSQDIYLSKTNALHLYFIIDERALLETQPAFIVTYNIVGCPDVKKPLNAIIKRTGMDLVVRCNHTRETWFLTCKNNKWVGEMGNCTTPNTAGSPWAVKGVLVTEIPLPHGLIIAVVLGIILGFLIGFISLGVLIHYRRRNFRAIPPPPPPPNSSHSKRVSSSTSYGLYPSTRHAHLYETPIHPDDRQNYFELDSDVK